jgi:hypothetical protein
MARYNVRMIQRIVEEAFVQVEAESQDAAVLAATSLANAGKVEWQFLSCDEPVEACSADQQP